MRKNRSLLPNDPGIVDADTRLRRADHASSPAHDVALGATKSSNHELALSRRPGGDFEMENYFWDRLEDICDTESLSFRQFGKRAQDRHPGLSLAGAVRTAIVEERYARPGAIPTSPMAPGHTLHEARSAQPTPITVGGIGVGAGSASRAFAVLELFSLKGKHGVPGASGSMPKPPTRSN